MLTIQEICRIEMNANRTPAYRGAQLLALCSDWREHERQLHECRRSVLSDRTAKADELQAQVSELRVMYAALEASVSLAENNNNTLVTLLDNARAQVKMYQEDIDKLKDQAGDLQVQVAVLEKSTLACAGQAAADRMENEKLKAQVADLQAEKDIAQKEITPCLTSP